MVCSSWTGTDSTGTASRFSQNNTVQQRRKDEKQSADVHWNSLASLESADSNVYFTQSKLSLSE